MSSIKVRREMHVDELLGVQSYYEPAKNKRWEIVIDGKVVEGGFFTRAAAEEQAMIYAAEDKERARAAKRSKVE